MTPLFPARSCKLNSTHPAEPISSRVRSAQGAWHPSRALSAAWFGLSRALWGWIVPVRFSAYLVGTLAGPMIPFLSADATHEQGRVGTCECGECIRFGLSQVGAWVDSGQYFFSFVRVRRHVRIVPLLHGMLLFSVCIFFVCAFVLVSPVLLLVSFLVSWVFRRRFRRWRRR